MMVEPASHDASFLRMLYAVALATAVQLSCADPEPASEDSVAAPIAGQADVLWFEASPTRPQAILCRLNAAKMAAACGVPLARLPSSSSIARSFENHEVTAH